VPSNTKSPRLSFEAARWVSFGAMFLGYGAFYLTRNSLAFTAPFMLEDKALGLDLKVRGKGGREKKKALCSILFFFLFYRDRVHPSIPSPPPPPPVILSPLFFQTTQAIGALTSILPVMYGFSKFASGVLGARTPPTALLAGGLLATAAANAAFGASSTFGLLALFWGLNGLLQGLGAPACARTLTSWYPESLRGTFWGFWTASNNVGGFAAPILAGTAARAAGWRAGMFAPAAVAAAVSILVALFMKESPEAAGYPPVTEPGKPAAVKQATTPEKKKTMMESLTQDCLRSPAVWLLALSYFFVYVVRQGVTSWFVFYLKARGVPNPAVAVSGLELGGLAGSLSAGALSDALLRRAKAAGGTAGSLGIRVRVVIAYSLATAAALGGVWALPASAHPAAVWAAVAGVGLALYGPQMLIGLCGAEAVPKAAVSAAQGFLGWVSYLGAANAGVPLAAIVQSKGWDAYFAALAACCGVVVALMLPLVAAPSYSQREARAAAAESGGAV
jgi:MFS transporter, OPA family, sugar phosphate sensor protein UhpC